jgi:single-stranded DNA-binding protein
MNRVTLSGWLITRPVLGHTIAGVPLTGFRLRVPRYDDTGATDEFDCVALREAAVELASHTQEGDRVNLDGRLRLETYWSLDGRRTRGVRIHVDLAYVVLAPPSPALPSGVTQPLPAVPLQEAA